MNVVSFLGGIPPRNPINHDAEIVCRRCEQSW